MPKLKQYNGSEWIEIAQNGKSAYELWVDAGNNGTHQDFLRSLKGEKGDSVEVKKVVKEVVEKATKEVQEKSDKRDEENIQRIQKHVASKTYSVSELEGMGDATEGQVPIKQADGTWSPGTPTGGGSGDMTKAVYDTNDDGVVDEAAVITGQGALATLSTVDTAQIDDEATTFAKMQHIATNRILGRSTAGTGDIEALADADARNIMGLGTADSPQFTGVNVGNATDTTITRVSAGVIAVEGNNVQLEPSEGGFADGDKTKLDAAVQPAVGENLTDVQELRIDGTPDADHTATGQTTDTFNAGETVTAFSAVSMKSDGEWHYADANETGTVDRTFMGVSLEAGTDGNPLHVALSGSFVRDDTWTWTVGGAIYVGTTPGQLTQTAPSATDDEVRVVGYAVSADVMRVEPTVAVVHA